MGDQTPSREEIIVVDPDYMSDVTKDNDGKDTEKGTNTGKTDTTKVSSADTEEGLNTEKTDTDEKPADGVPDDKKKEKEDAGMGNYSVRIPSPVLWW